jgi:hypothetical protein
MLSHKESFIMPQPSSPTPTSAHVSFVSRDTPEVIEVDITGDLTGQAAILGLVEQAGYAPPSESLGYALKLKRTNAELPLDRPLLQCGVVNGDIIQVVRSDVAAWGTP